MDRRIGECVSPKTQRQVMGKNKRKVQELEEESGLPKKSENSHEIFSNEKTTPRETWMIRRWSFTRIQPFVSITILRIALFLGPGDG